MSTIDKPVPGVSQSLRPAGGTTATQTHKRTIWCVDNSSPDDDDANAASTDLRSLALAVCDTLASANPTAAQWTAVKDLLATTSDDTLTPAVLAANVDLLVSRYPAVEVPPAAMACWLALHPEVASISGVNAGGHVSVHHNGRTVSTLVATPDLTYHQHRGPDDDTTRFTYLAAVAVPPGSVDLYSELRRRGLDNSPALAAAGDVLTATPTTRPPVQR